MKGSVPKTGQGLNRKVKDRLRGSVDEERSRDEPGDDRARTSSGSRQARTELELAYAHHERERSWMVMKHVGRMKE